MTNLSPNFTLEELTFSSTGARHGIDNTPSQEVVGELTRLCETVLEPVRALLGVPMHTDSGFRCFAINTLVKGSENSQHMLGQAADEIPQGFGLRAAFDTIRHSPIPYDQIIIECGTWIHLSCARDGQPARRQALIGTLVDGAWHYAEVANA